MSCTVPFLAHTFVPYSSAYFPPLTHLHMKASSFKPVFLILLAFNVAACRTGVAPNIGLDVSVLPKVISISSKLTASPEYSAATDTVVVTLPSMVE